MWELLFDNLPHFPYFYEIRLIELWENRTGGQRHHAQLSFPSRCLENENSKEFYNLFFLKMERFKKIETVENKKINHFLPFIFWNSLLPASNWIFAYKAENQKNKFTVIKYVKMKCLNIIVFIYLILIKMNPTYLITVNLFFWFSAL